MKRTAALAILFLVALCAGLSAPAQSADPPVTFHIAFTGDSSRLVVASHVGGIRVLSVPDLKEVRSFALAVGRPLRSAAVSPNGRWLAADDDGDLMVWNLETGEQRPSVPITHHHRYIHPVYVFGPDDDTLFVYEDILHVWDVKQGRDLGVVSGIGAELMTVSPDGRSLVVLGGCDAGRISGTLCVYAIDRKNIVVATKWMESFKDSGKQYASWYPQDLVYTKDGRILLTAKEDQGTFHSRFYKPADLTVLEDTVVEPERGWLYPGLRSTPTQQLETVSPDGKWKVTGFHKRLYLYRVTSETTRALERFTAIP
jgi:WD40 repeat protein